MKPTKVLLLLLSPLLASAAWGDMPDPKPPHAALAPVPFTDVKIDDPFWSPRIKTTQETTIPSLLKASEGRIDNFSIIAGQKSGKLRLMTAPDSDLYKILEAAAYSLAWRKNPALEKQVDQIIAKIAAAQTEDGYLNTQYTLPLGHPASPPPNHRRVGRYGYGPSQRWKGTMAEWPKGIGQLYCAGHLFEAAAAYYRVTGKRNFLDVACKLADHVDRAFPRHREIEYADHPQIEIGLVKLYQVTGRRRYLELANHIAINGTHSRPVDIGEGESHKRLLKQQKAFGHCVRTTYLYAGATDLAAYLGHPRTLATVDRLWKSIVDSRIYVHGGVGDGTGYEQHGQDYQLRNERCYCECCANIAQAQWNLRLNGLHGDASYADLVEVVAYNGGLSGISLAGTEYFYTNLLAAGRSGRNGPHEALRRNYLFCCPSKLPGFVAGIGRWIYSKDDAALYVNMYVGSSAKIDLRACAVNIRQRTRYPWQGKVTLEVDPAEPAGFGLCLRIPAWCGNSPLPGGLYRFGDPNPLPVSLKVNGQAVEMPPLEKGYARITRQWKKGDTVEIDMPMPTRRVYADQRVAADLGRVALMRGPIVYCLEEIDNPRFSVLNMALPKNQEPLAEHRDDLLGGVTVLKGQGLADGKTPVEFTAVPYYAWQNRGLGEMNVWIIEDLSLCKKPTDIKIDPTNRAAIARASASVRQQAPNTVDAMRDGLLPPRPADGSTPRTLWPQRNGSTQWVQYEFGTPQNVDHVSVYWATDDNDNGSRAPEHWRLLYKSPNGSWLPVANQSEYSTTPGKLNSVRFDPLRTTALRIEARLRKGFSGGLFEWRIEPFRNIEG